MGSNEESGPGVRSSWKGRTPPAVDRTRGRL
jgi:hypothetical protein